jgi:arylsulfatase A-like enzyme
VVLTSDHGEAFGEHGNKAHGSTVYEEEVRVPLVLWVPGFEGARHREPVSLVDLSPTLLELAGLRNPPGLCGQSLAPVVRGEHAAVRRPVYVAALPDETGKAFKLALVEGYHKLIIDGHSGAKELFDLKVDPKEQNDLSSQDPARLQIMQAAFHQFMQDNRLNPSHYPWHAAVAALGTDTLKNREP